MQNNLLCVSSPLVTPASVYGMQRTFERAGGSGSVLGLPAPGTLWYQMLYMNPCDLSIADSLEGPVLLFSVCGLALLVRGSLRSSLDLYFLDGFGMIRDIATLMVVGATDYKLNLI